MRSTNPVRLTILSVTMVMVLGFTATAALGALGQSGTQSGDLPGDRSAGAPGYSHRLIVELGSPAAAAWADTSTDQTDLYAAGGRLDLGAERVQSYIRSLEAEQALFAKQLHTRVPGADIGTFIDENGRSRSLAYQVVFNGVVVDAGQRADFDTIAAALRTIPGVRSVSRDRLFEPDLYASLPLINAAGTWNHAAIGGIDNAGAGVKIASVDGGIHHAGAMFDGTDFEMPAGYPLGFTANTNGKIIASRAYFRSWDPPLEGEQYGWPGPLGISHGQHTASTAMGNAVEIDYGGDQLKLSGVAPRAYAMSYKTYYASVQGISGMYGAESLAAIEDAVRDGANVMNNSWGGGAYGVGGEAEPTDMALVNATRAGVFVSMSAGNSGPNLHTVDHPSADYMNVANSTTTGAYADVADFSVTSPEPVPDDHKGMLHEWASFGESYVLGKTYGPYEFLPAAAVSETNITGCKPFEEGDFEGKLAVISRGDCEFGIKALHAEQAGAVAVVVHNNAAGGDALVFMGPGADGENVTIPALFISYANGMRLTAWHEQHGDASRLAFSITVEQVGNTPDLIAYSSSRGPAVGFRLKPDIAAPGTNILAQGYGNGQGEERHLGYGQASGTSMAAPHIAGAAALIKQVHPDWSPAWIKSALMTTSKYTDIFLDGAPDTPAQPLQMGAGRLDLTHAADPGVILDPPMLSFGPARRGGGPIIDVKLTSVAEDAETYQLSTRDTSEGFTTTVPVAGLSVTPEQVTIEPGETVTVTVRWNTREAKNELGNNQGYLVIDGESHEAHMSAWIQITDPTRAEDVLLIDNDGSGLSDDVKQACVGAGQPLPNWVDFTHYYTEALEAAGLTYKVLDVDVNVGTAEQVIPDAHELLRYRVVLHQTGDNFCSVLTSADQQRFVEHLNHGGAFIGFGQDMASVLGSADGANPENATAFYQYHLGSQYLQDSVNAETVYTDTAQLIVGVPYSPLRGKMFDVSASGDGAGNQVWIDEIRPTRGDAVVPGEEDSSRPLLMFPTGVLVENGFVAMNNRDRPILEYPLPSWLGKTVYFGFGLEGVNDDTGYNTRAELMEAALQLALDDATVDIVADARNAHEVSTFVADMRSATGGPAVSLRWDFGDGHVQSDPFPVNAQVHAGHTYRSPGTYVVRVQAENALGTRVVGATTIDVGLAMGDYIDRRATIFLPSSHRMHALEP